jgi:membrane associated rhomboid family serine protease
MVNQPKLTGWTPMVVGVLAVVLGGLWTLQGLDVVGGSVMSGVSAWAVIGPIVAGIGLILIVIGVRRRSRAKR